MVRTIQVITTEGDVVAMATTGLFSDSEIEVRFTAVIVFIFAQYVATFAVTVPFVYRYMHICR